jgi:DNA modification methylase
MKGNKLYIADCFDIIGSVVKKVDYVFAGPPDFAELGLDPVKNFNEYFDFLDRCWDELKQITDCITISLTDRKCNSVIIPKHKYIIDFFKESKWYFKSHKIWVKSDKINLYRLNYSHIMTFSKNKAFSSKLNQANQGDFLHDCFAIPLDYKKFKYGMPVKLVEIYVRAHTLQGQTVFDPFTGSGTTALAAIKNHRRFLGSEISWEYGSLCDSRIKEIKSELFTSEIIKRTAFKVIFDYGDKKKKAKKRP